MKEKGAEKNRAKKEAQTKFVHLQKHKQLAKKKIMQTDIFPAGCLLLAIVWIPMVHKLPDWWT